jgi:hypothetical protein
MPSQYTLPPDTRSVGSGNPPADMNNVVDALTAMGATHNVLNASYAGGADPTGTADCTAAIQAAVNALPPAPAGGTVILPDGGTYRVNSTITIARPGVWLYSRGSVINYYGSGDCIRMYSPNSYTAGWGGGIIGGLVIDGTNASAGACGAHIGDIYQLQLDFGVRNFQGANSKGAWFDCQYYWAEDMYGHLFAQQNTTNVIFDNSANLTGQATGSYARTNLTIVMDAKGVGDGVIIKNAAQVYASEFVYVGNMDYSSTATKHWALTIAAPAGFSYTATSASPCVFTATGHYYGNGTNVFLAGGTAPTGFTNGASYYVVNTSIGAGTFQLSATAGGPAINSTSTGNGTVNTFTPSRMEGRLNINIECNAVNANPQPGTINFTSAGTATGYNSIAHASGVIDFSQTSTGLAGAANAAGNFFFDGPVYGDANLWRSLGLGASAYFNGPLASSTTIQASGIARSVVNTTTALTGMILQNGSADAQTVVVENNGTGSITFAAAGTSHVKNGTSCVISANTALMFQWRPDQGAWYAMSG